MSPVVIACAALLLASCRAPAPAQDELVVAMSTFSEGTFLPWNGSTGRKLYLDLLYEYLVYLDPETLQRKPGLAESWEMSADGKVFTFHLRKGVQFRDGWGELTSADVKYTLERIRDPKAIAGPSSPLRKSVASVTAPDRYTVVIALKTPDIDFINGYIANGQIVPIVSERYVREKGDAEANLHPVGTSPFRLARQKKDVYIEMERVADYAQHWRVQPDFARIRFMSVPEEFTRAAMLKTGEVDIAPVNYDSIKALQAGGLKVMFVKRNWAPVVRMGGLVPRFPRTDAPWSDKRVRQAMNYAVDKDAIVRSIFHGHAAPAGIDFPAPEWFDIPPYPYDPAKARKLLAEAGHPNGFDVEIATYTTNPGAELPFIAQAVALYWEAIGLNVRIVPSNWSSFRGAWTSGNANDVTWTHRGLPFISTLAGLQASYSSASVFAGFSNADVDGWIARIELELDATRRLELQRQFGEHMREEAGTIFIALADEPYGTGAKVGKWATLSQQTTNIDSVTRALPSAH